MLSWVNGIVALGNQDDVDQIECDLNDGGLLIIEHASGEDNDTYIFTKNASGDISEKHIPVLVGNDEYMDGDVPPEP